MSLNKVFIGGIVAEKPMLCSDSYYGNALKVSLNINRKDRKLIEHVSCFIINDNLIERALNEIHVGDYLISQSGRLVSFEEKISREFQCPYCGESETKRRSVESMDVLLYEFQTIKGVSLNDSIGINKVVLVGKVQEKPRLYYNKKTNEVSWAKFRISVTRGKGVEKRLSEIESNDVKFRNRDYIYINVPNRICQSVYDRIDVHQFLLIEGMVQERINGEYVLVPCKGCGNQTERIFDYTHREVVAWKINPCHWEVEETSV